MNKRFSALLLAAAVVAGPVFAQVTPGDPAAGTVPYATTPGNPQGASAPRHHRHRHRAHHRRHHHAARPTTTDTNPGTGLNGSDAPSR